MRFASLGSGSSGNATVVAFGNDAVLVDCGFSIKDTVQRLSRLDLVPESLSAIIVTHEHSDHVKGVAPFARKYKIPVYMTEGTFACKDFGLLPSLHIIRNYENFNIGPFHIEPVVVPHDAREPAQFVFESPERVRLGILTDLGSITPHVLQAYEGCHGLLVEANHDLEMLANGPYPPSLKSRVSSAWGHLNNKQTADFLNQLGFETVQEIVVGHISEKNNSVERVRTQLKSIIERAKSLRFACQEQGFDWISLKV